MTHIGSVHKSSAHHSVTHLLTQGMWATMGALVADRVFRGEWRQGETGHRSPRSVLCARCSLHYTLYTVLCALCSAHCALHAALCTRYSVRCIASLYAVLCALHSAHWALCTALCTLYYLVPSQSPPPHSQSRSIGGGGSDIHCPPSPPPSQLTDSSRPTPWAPAHYSVWGGGEWGAGTAALTCCSHSVCRQ